MSQSTLFGPAEAKDENLEYLRTKRMGGVRPDASMLWSLESTISEDPLGVWWRDSRCTKHPDRQAMMFDGEKNEYLCSECRGLE